MKKIALSATAKIKGVLKSRKTGLTVPELARVSNVNINTARRILGSHSAFDRDTRKCRVSKKARLAYSIHTVTVPTKVVTTPMTDGYGLAA